MATQVDFYLLQNAIGKDACEQFACRLLNKIYRQNQQAAVLLTDSHSAEQFNDLLWTFNDISFVPHRLVTENNPAPIVLGWSLDSFPADLHTLIINLTNQALVSTTTLQRIIEIVASDPNSKQAGRTRYRAYQQQAYTLHTHTIN
ncbi:MAG: DNA polymerase III subunit chi [Gammaproteobacteria bacterium]